MSIRRDVPSWLREGGVRLNVDRRTSLAELTATLQELSEAHPDAKVDLDCDHYGASESGYSYIEVDW